MSFDSRSRGTTYVVEDGAAGERFDRWLAARTPLGSRSRAADALLHGRIWMNDVEQTVSDGARRLAGGEVVRVWIDRPGSASRQGPHRSGSLDILFEDADLIVLDKPPGLLTVPLPEQRDAPSLAEQLQQRWRSHARQRPLAVHRLDRDTSGLVVFARSRRAQHGLRQQFASRTPERIYLALVLGIPEPAEGTWQTWLTWDERACVQRPAAARAPGAREAIGRYRLVERFPSFERIADRSPSRHRQAAPDPGTGVAGRASARRRAGLRWSGGECAAS